VYAICVGSVFCRMLCDHFSEILQLSENYNRLSCQSLERKLFSVSSTFWAIMMYNSIVVAVYRHNSK